MWVRRLLNTLRTARLQRDIERELSFHVAERADGLEAAGANREDALRQARIRLGGRVAQIEATRDVDISRSLDTLLRNVRHAGRALARTPGFTVTVVLTLALGIGANSAVFSAIDAVLLRPLPYPDSDRLVLITQAREGFGDTGVAPVRIADWNRLNTTFDGISGYFLTDAIDARGELPERFRHAMVSPGFLRVVGVAPARGRDFVADEHRLNAPASIIISDRSYFSTLRIPVVAGDLCQRTADAGGAQGVVTEVMVNRQFAERYLGGRSAVGLHLAGGLDYLVTNRHLAAAPAGRITGVVGDAREHGVDRDPVPTVYTCFTAADPAPWFLVRTVGDPTARATDLRRAIHDIEPRRAVYDVEPLERRMDNAYAPNRPRTWLMVLFAATALALACAGVYGTLAYVVGSRRREVALRLALGARRSDVVRQLLTTSSRVVALAIASGLGLALLFTRSLTTMLYGVSPADPVTLAAVVLLVVVVATLAGLIPAARAAFVQPMRMLREE